MEHLLNTNKPQPRRKAFTIVELLVVIAVIAVLAGIFFGVGNGVRERAKISRAQSDLVLLAQYLEQYKGHYGDYPRVALSDSDSSAVQGSKVEGEDAAVQLYNALNGMRGARVGATYVFTTQERAFIDRSKFNYEYTPSQNPPVPSNPEIAPAVLLDPWGNAYRYYYPPIPAPPPDPNPWENTGYVLYSTGPSGNHVPPSIATRGYSDKADAGAPNNTPGNLDNIYAN